MIESFIEWLRRVVTQPRRELDRWQRAARFAYDLGRYGERQLRRDRAPQMAAALSFRSLFALVPVLIVGMIVVRAFQGTDAFVEMTKEILATLEFDQVTQTPLTSDGAPVPNTSDNLAAWLERIVNQAASVRSCTPTNLSTTFREFRCVPARN